MSPNESTTSAPAAAFDPLDLRNYSLERFKEIRPGRLMAALKMYGVPIAIIAFFFFHLKWCVSGQREGDSPCVPRIAGCRAG